MHPFSPTPLLSRDLLSIGAHRSILSTIDRVLRVGLVATLLAFGVEAPVHAQPQRAESVKATDLYHLREIDEVVLSPSGRFVAYTVRQVVEGEERPGEAESVHRTQLYVRTSRGGDGRLLTRTKRDARQPAWHPDGSKLAFVRPVEGTPQIFIISLSGGEPYQLTDTPHGAIQPTWSPSGDRLLFTSVVPESVVAQQTGRPAPSERPGRMPGDLVRDPAPDTIVVLRHAASLEPVDTLEINSRGVLQLTGDSSRTLRTPRTDAAADSLSGLLADSLRVLSSDSVRVLLDRLRLHPDTTTIPVVPDTVATPNGDLIQMRRWMNQRSPGTVVATSRLQIHGERHLDPTPQYRHHFLVEVPSIELGSPRRPTPWPLTTGYRSFGRAQWLPGGSQIVVSGTPETARHPDRVQKRNLYVVDVNRKRVRRLLEIKRYSLTSPTLAADGERVAFRARPLSRYGDEHVEIGLFALNGRSDPRLITSEFDRDVRQIRWSPDGWYLYTAAPSGGGAPIFRFSPFSPDTTAAPSMRVDQPVSRDTFAVDSTMIRPAPYRQMTETGRTVRDFDVTDATAVYTATDARSPSALYTNTVSFANERRISNQNSEWVSSRTVSIPRQITVRSDSLRVNGWVTRPPGTTDSLRHPFVVLVRGGPDRLDAVHTPEAWLERQFLAGRGIGVVEVTPRGSVGYGMAYRQANDGNWGRGPADDVLAVADSVAALAWTDSTQQAIAGASYGATLATWLVGQTDRFAAAVGLNGVYDLSALADGGRAWRLIRQEFGGFPWSGAPAPRTAPPLFSVGTMAGFAPEASPWETIHRNSPATYANQIQSPVLLLQGAADRRVGRTQSERMYKRLKLLNRQAEYVEYPDVGHDVAATATPLQRVDRLVRTYEFLARFLEMPSAEATTNPSTPELP